MKQAVANPNPATHELVMNCSNVLLLADKYSLTLLKMTNCNLEPDSCMKLTVLMEVNEVQREGSTLSHTPDRLQVLLIMVVVVGQ